MNLQNNRSGAYRLAFILAAVSSSVFAQPAAEPASVPASSRILVWLQGSTGLIAVFLVVLAVILFLAIRLLSGRHGHAQAQLGNYYTEPEVASSKFEQLQAEIQGLSLRLQGGENKGYYRKIEQLARIYMERIGFTGARTMSAEEIQIALAAGAIQPKQASVLSTIIERSRQGAEHESEKLDFTAADLLRELRVLVKQADETPGQTA